MNQMNWRPLLGTVLLLGGMSVCWANSLHAYKPQTDVAPTVERSASAVNDEIEELLSRVSTPEEDPQAKKMQIPEKGTSTDFLYGNWRCKTGLVNTRTKEDIVVDFVFDKNGGGHSLVREKNGQIYLAPVKTKLKDGELTIETGTYTETRHKDSYYASQKIVCRQEGDDVACSGHSSDADGGPHWHDARFTRLKDN